MENGNYAHNPNPLTGPADKREIDTGIRDAKGSWTSPTMTRLSGKETNGKTTYTAVEAYGSYGPS